MVLVDCPLCDRPAPIDPDAEALDCPACRARLPLAPDRKAALDAAA